MTSNVTYMLRGHYRCIPGELEEISVNDVDTVVMEGMSIILIFMSPALPLAAVDLCQVNLCMHNILYAHQTTSLFCLA